MRNMQHRANGGQTLPELEEYFATVNVVAEDIFRSKVLKWRAQEREGSDPYLFWTHLYFAFRVHPSSVEEVQKMWDMYEPAYLYIYTQSALASRQRGYKLFNDALRRMCQILLSGSVDHKNTLLKELKKVQELMLHIVDRKELERAINALEMHLEDPSKLPYIYGTLLLHKEAQEHEQIARNPLLRSKMAEEDYKMLRDRQESLRASGLSSTPQQGNTQSGGNNSDFEPMADDVSLPGADAPSLATKDLFKE